MWLKNKIVSIGLLSIVLLFAGCSMNVPSVSSFSLDGFEEIDNPEDILIVEGYEALDNQDLKDAEESFLQAYQLSGNKSYLKEVIGILLLEQEDALAKEQALQYLQKYPKDEDIRQTLVGILSKEGDLKGAQKEATTLLKNHRSAQNLEIISSVYLLQKQYQKSIKYLQEAYALDKDEVILDKIASIYFVFLKNKQKAIEIYERHIKNYGISPLIGERLAMIYLQDKAYKKAAIVYEKLFKTTGEQNYAKNVLEIYFQFNDLTQAQKFLERNPSIHLVDELLLEIYRHNKDYKKSIEVLERIYQQTHNVNFLAIKAMMIYESAKNRNDQKMLDAVVKELKIVTQNVDDALYWNYLGYLMIDHNLNIKEGMEYVTKALQKEPQNVYYLDSLAWGYYQLKDCENAKMTMEKIPLEEIQKEEEIKDHFEVIRQCKIKE
ncbi:tetratricopeptide repeat protein [Helicobacter mesocricetorum]|uniref:hypothetical protein n=1 Tax=Helicobacter mesocricetorum TaxID=87012 RepID=UPI000CF05D25|nr:hypothetical protein [Helicobacter mesocricetorum]